MGILTTVIDPNLKIPGSFIQVSLGTGPRSPASGAYKLLCVGLKTAGGSAAVSELKQVTGPDDARAYFGAGSELDLMLRALFRANPTATVYAVAMDPAGGTAGTKALVFTGTSTADGIVEVWVLGERVVATIPSGSNATVTGDLVRDAINARTELPVTAGNSTGTVTLTAKNTGPRSGAISVRSLATVTGISHTPATGYCSAGSAGSENATTQLDAVAGERFHLIVSPHFDATNLGKFKSAVTAQALPVVGHRGRWLAAFGGTYANFITLSDALNDPRGQIDWIENPDDTPGMIAACHAGAHAAAVSRDRAFNTDGLTLPGLKAQYSVSDRPTRTEQNGILSNGGTPLVTSAGVVSVLRSVTNYHQDGSGNDDFSILDTHKVEVADYIGDSIDFNFGVRFRGFKLAPDDSDGEPPPPKVATPLSVRDWIYGLLKDEENELIVRVDENLPNLIVELDDDVDGRLNAEVPCEVIDLFHQLGANVAQS